MRTAEEQKTAFVVRSFRAEVTNAPHGCGFGAGRRERPFRALCGSGAGSISSILGRWGRLEEPFEQELETSMRAQLWGVHFELFSKGFHFKVFGKLNNICSCDPTCVWKQLPKQTGFLKLRGSRTPPPPPVFLKNKVAWVKGLRDSG